MPVIASGDIAATGAIGVSETRALCARLLDGGVAAVMVARAAVGRPWVFDELLSGDAGPAPAARLAEVRRFVADVEAAMGRRAVGHLRQFWLRFRRHGALDPALARELMVATELADIDRLLAGAG